MNDMTDTCPFWPCGEPYQHKGPCKVATEWRNLKPTTVNYTYERIEAALIEVLDDDEAADLTLMLKEEPESVMNILYERWPTRHDSV